MHRPDCAREPVPSGTKNAFVQRRRIRNLLARSGFYRSAREQGFIIIQFDIACGGARARQEGLRHLRIFATIAATAMGWDQRASVALGEKMPGTLQPSCHPRPRLNFDEHSTAMLAQER